MKTLKNILAVTVFAAGSLFTLIGHAQPAGGDMNITEGEVRKVDKDNKKITLKHGEIKNLDMPGMTMVFSVSDPAMLDKVKAGDKVRFMASNADGKITVTHIQPAK